jgi:hypothetical protein
MRFSLIYPFKILRFKNNILIFSNLIFHDLKEKFEMIIILKNR